MTAQPNILWISTHDINPHLGTYSGVWPGAESAVTPHLDRLAAEGVRYDQAFAAAPVCAPSRSAIMTGRYPISIGTHHMRSRAVPPPEVTLLSQLLRAEGYYVTNNWFTDFQMDVPELAYDDLSPQGHWRNRPSEGTPFFASFHGMITHESQIYLDDDEFAKATSHVPDGARQDPAEVLVPPYYPDTEVFRRSWARYLELITEMDAWVGGILAELAEDGLERDTIVVFWSDHGLGMPRAKRWSNEAGLREPLIIRWPGRLKAGASREEVVQLIDLAPTMLLAAGASIPEHFQGTALFDAEGGTLAAAPFAYGARDRMDEQVDSSRTVRDNRYRYTRNLHPDRSGMQHLDYADHLHTWGELRRLNFAEANQRAVGEVPSLLTPLQRSITAPSKPAEELYDIAADPHETINLVDDPDYREALVRLRAAMDEWLETCGDMSVIDEDDLAEQWRPGGKRRHTETPSVQLVDGLLSASCGTSGAAIGWTTVSVDNQPELSPMERMLGIRFTGDRVWNLLTEPVEIPLDIDVFVAAFRIGYEPSDEVVVRADSTVGA